METPPATDATLRRQLQRHHSTTWNEMAVWFASRHGRQSRLWTYLLHCALSGMGRQAFASCILSIVPSGCLRPKPGLTNERTMAKGMIRVAVEGREVMHTNREHMLLQTDCKLTSRLPLVDHRFAACFHVFGAALSFGKEANSKEKVQTMLQRILDLLRGLMHGSDLLCTADQLVRAWILLLGLH